MKCQESISKFAILLQLLTLSQYSKAQIGNFEELATNFFLDSIYLTMYTDLKAEFSGQTESEISGYLPRFEQIDSTIEGINRSLKLGESKEIVKINTSSSKIKLKNKRIGNKPKIYVYPRIFYKGTYYVYIVVFKHLNYVGHHLFAFDNSGRLLNNWYTGEII